MTAKWNRTRKTTPNWCRIKTCPYTTPEKISNHYFCDGCNRLKADWRLP